VRRIEGPLSDLLKTLHLAEPMAGWEAVEIWPEVVGERIAAHARATAFREGVMMVEVDTPSWMNELAYLRRRIVSDMNERMGKAVVTEIRLLPAGNSGDTRSAEKEP
jgi:predicted nucleic acid-binding Zn ribbon protein